MVNKKWGNFEVNFIRKHIDDMTDREMAKELGRVVGRIISLEGLRKFRQRLGLRRGGHLKKGGKV